MVFLVDMEVYMNAVLRLSHLGLLYPALRIVRVYAPPQTHRLMFSNAPGDSSASKVLLYLFVQRFESSRSQLPLDFYHKYLHKYLTLASGPQYHDGILSWLFAVE